MAFPYPVVMKGPGEAVGSRVDAFTAWSFQAGKWIQVPIQAEEVNAQGDYVLAGGMPFTRGTDDGRFDANDELVVAGEDLGDDFQAPELKGLPPQTSVRQQWKVGFCRGPVRAGWLLIQSRYQPKPWVGAPAVSFDQGKGELASTLYRYRFDKKNPVLLGEVALEHDGRPEPIIRDSKVLMPLKTPFYLPDLTFEDKDFTSSIESWQSGPLRTIVAVGVKYTSFLSLFRLHLFSELVFYKNRFVIPTVVQFVFDPAEFLKPGSGLAYSLRFPSGKAWRVTSNLAPFPHQPPEEALGEMKTAADTEVFQAQGHGPEGAFFVQVRVDAAARRSVPPPFLLTPADFASPEAQAAWPWLKQLTGDLGVFLDFSQIRQGTYDFGLDLLLSPKANESFTDYGSVDTEWQPFSLGGTSR